MSHHNFQHYLMAWLCSGIACSAAWPYWEIVGPTQYNRGMVMQYYSGVVERCVAAGGALPQSVAAYTVIKAGGTNTSYETAVWTNAYFRSPIVWTSTAGYVSTNYPALRVADIATLDLAVDSVETSYIADWRLTNSYAGRPPWFQSVDRFTNRMAEMPWLTKAETFIRTGVGVVTNIGTNALGIRTGLTFWTKWDVQPQDLVISEWLWTGSAWSNLYSAAAPSNYFAAAGPIIRVFPGGANYDNDFSVQWSGNYIEVTNGQMVTMFASGDADPYIASPTNASDGNPLDKRWTQITALSSGGNAPLNTGDTVAFVYKGSFAEYGDQPAKLRATHINERVKRLNALTHLAAMFSASGGILRAGATNADSYGEARIWAESQFSGGFQVLASNASGRWRSGAIALEADGLNYEASTLQWTYQAQRPPLTLPSGSVQVWFGGLGIATNAQSDDDGGVFVLDPARNIAQFSSIGGSHIDGWHKQASASEYIYDLNPSTPGIPPPEAYITNMTGESFFDLASYVADQTTLRLPGQAYLDEPLAVEFSDVPDRPYTVEYARGFSGGKQGGYGAKWAVYDMRGVFIYFNGGAMWY